MSESQLEMFTDMLQLKVGMGLSIYNKNYPDEVALHCTVTGIDLDKNTVQFSVSNGGWEGKLHIHRNLIQIGLDSEATVKVIHKYEFYHKDVIEHEDEIPF